MVTEVVYIHSEEEERLTKELRNAKDRLNKEFDRGFAACLTMVMHGASVERLLDCIRFPENIPQKARMAKGTRRIDPNDETVKIKL